MAKADRSVPAGVWEPTLATAPAGTVEHRRQQLRIEINLLTGAVFDDRAASRPAAVRDTGLEIASLWLLLARMADLPGEAPAPDWSRSDG